MMYADVQYYRNIFYGIHVEDTQELERMLKRASDHVDQVTNYRLFNKDFDSLAGFFQEQVKKAVCSQVEYIVRSGGLDSFGSGDVSQVGVGEFNYQTGQVETQSLVSSETIEYLKPTGLMYTGISTITYIGDRHVRY